MKKSRAVFCGYIWVDAVANALIALREAKRVAESDGDQGIELGNGTRTALADRLCDLETMVAELRTEMENVD